jgi:hypothetical protein
MARQKGLLIIEGTIGGLNFYIRKGEPLVRAAGGGFTAEAIRKSPSMERTRENFSEFSGCMKTVKHFKMAMVSFLCLFKDGTMHQRLVSLMTKIKDSDVVSARGSRHVGQGILTEAGKALLRGYVYTPGPTLEYVLGQSYSFQWDGVGFSIPNFSMKAVRFPKGATHLELQVAAMRFDFSTYASTFVTSEPLVLGKNEVISSIALAPTSFPDGEGTAIGLVFLRFYQEVNGVRHAFKEEKYVVLEGVFV